ncbi:MAG: alpha-amylase family glycosyl hydrolase, partial [Gemmataceae bacterium]
MLGKVALSEPQRGQSLPTARLASTAEVFETSRGSCRPFGAVVRDNGVNFAVFSRHAHAVTLVLFREGREEPIAEIPLDPACHKTGDVWHIFVRGLSSDVLYGYRVQGPGAVKHGHRFNPALVLLDPYARALSGNARWGQPDVPLDLPQGRLSRRGRIVVEDFDWQDDRAPNTPWPQTVIYELHVRGYTRHASSAVAHPGTYLGLIDKIPYLKSLGVTAVQLMPVFEFDELEHAHRHPASGEVLLNYWGYSPLSFFAPKAAYAAVAGEQRREFKDMVKAFHQAGLEVILDVVYNHTCEGNQNGPTLSLRGIDNAVYYKLAPESRYYMDFTGCGNSLNMHHPRVLQFIMDSLRYWVLEMHVDGFRFDLASTLARELFAVDKLSTFFDIIQQDPVLS